MSLTLITVVILIGLLLIVTEVFLVPGSTFVGVLGLIVVGVGIYYSFESFGFRTGAAILVGSGVVITALTYIGLKRMSNSKFTVKAAIDGKVNEFDYSHINIGDEGVTLTALRPEGKAIINDERITVFSKGFYIDTNMPVVVVNIKENKIIVEQK